MNAGKIFTVVVIAIICSSSAMFVLFNSDEVEATDRNNSNLTEDGDLRTLYVSSGDYVSLSFEGEGVEITGTPPSNLKISGNTIRGIMNDSKSTFEMKVTSNTPVKTLIIENRTMYNSINDTKLEGYGTEQEPWKYYVNESSEFSVDFRSTFGSITHVSNMPPGISQNVTKITGVLGEDSAGDYMCEIVTDKNTYYMEISVINIFPSWVSATFIVVALVILALVVMLWSSKYGIGTRKND